MSDGQVNNYQIHINGESLFANEAVRELARAALQQVIEEAKQPPQPLYTFTRLPPEDIPDLPPVHRDCAGCFFSSIDHLEPGGLICRRNPPFRDQRFPLTRPEDWCGEWQQS